MRKVSVAERLRHQERDAQDQFALGKILSRPLMRRMSRSVRLKRSAIHQINVAQKKHTLPRHSTSSKKTTQSISSKREPSGWSKWERPKSKLSRHRNLSPGVPHGIAKLTANGLWPSVIRPSRGE